MKRMKHKCVECGEATFSEFKDTGYYYFQCSSGHEFRCLLYQQYFELLFEMGVHAIHDKYYREAVMCFHSSLERIYEVFIKVYLYESNTKEHIVDELFKQVYLSERKYGAFISSYISAFSRMPKVLPPKLVKFRNEVAHKGRAPTRGEAMDFGQAVMSIQRPVINRMKYRLKTGTHILIKKHEEKALKASGYRRDLIALNAITSAPSLTINAPYKRKFKMVEVVEELKNGPWGLET